jgi:hypothetical protein
MTTPRRLAAVVATLALALPGRAFADENGPGDSGKSRPSTARGKVLRPVELKIQGEVEKAKATAITAPAMAGRRRFEEDVSFTRKVLEALEKEPF